MTNIFAISYMKAKTLLKHTQNFAWQIMSSVFGLLIPTIAQ